jgi:hypothetical protein
MFGCCHFYILLLTRFFISAIIELNTCKGGTILDIFVVGDAPSAFNTTSLDLAIGIHDLYAIVCYHTITFHRSDLTEEFKGPIGRPTDPDFLQHDLKEAVYTIWIS